MPVRYALAGVLNLLVRLALPLAIVVGLALVAGVVGYVLNREAWTLNWTERRRLLGRVSGYLGVGMLLIAGWSALRQTLPLNGRRSSGGSLRRRPRVRRPMRRPSASLDLSRPRLSSAPSLERSRCPLHGRADRIGGGRGCWPPTSPTPRRKTYCGWRTPFGGAGVTSYSPRRDEAGRATDRFRPDHHSSDLSSSSGASLRSGIRGSLFLSNSTPEPVNARFLLPCPKPAPSAT